MEECQSGFHGPELKLNISKISLASGQVVTLCNLCFSRIMNAKNYGGDLTMDILYYWAKEYGNVPKLLESLKNDCLKRCHLIQFVNDELAKMRRNINQNFPIILLNPDEKDKFIQVCDYGVVVLVQLRNVGRFLFLSSILTVLLRKKNLIPQRCVQPVLERS
jgi:hypothetical protein